MFPFKEERSRNKERLEASLAALCELELLKQRQESRVLGALCLGDNSADSPGRTAWTSLGAASSVTHGEDAQDYGQRVQAGSLQCTPWGIMASLEQHVAQLKVNAEVKLADLPTVLEDGQPPTGEMSSPKEDVLTVETSAFHQRLPRSLSAPNGAGDIEPRDNWLSDLARSTLFADALAELKSLEQSQEGTQQAQKAETYIFGLIQRKALPPRPSKPRTSLAADARATGVVRQSSLCRKDEQLSPKQTPIQVIPQLPSPVVQTQVQERIPSLAAHSLDQERYQGTVYIDEAPPPYHHLQQSDQHQPGPYHKAKQVPLVANRSISLEYPTCRVIPTQVDSSNSNPDSPQNFQVYSQVMLKPQQLPTPEEHLVNAEYIPAQPCRASTRAYAHHHPPNHHHSSGKGSSKPSRSTYSPERAHQHQEQQQHQPTQSQPSRSRSNAKKSDKNGAARKQGKKACRSQSENSLQRAPERKYNTVERDGAGSGSGSRGSRSSQSKSKKQQQQQQQQHGNGHYRRWQSSLELSQDEAEQPQGQTHAQPHSASNQRDQCPRRTRKSRPAHPAYAYPVQNHHQQHHHHHHHSHHHDRHVEYQLDARPVEDYHHTGPGESESSSSDADSPESSSLSSDSDESGGLVWPQQLPPQLSQPPPASATSTAAAASSATPGAPLQQKAFVKIKASHALKKKILRFRTGSLKVMTTV